MRKLNDNRDKLNKGFESKEYAIINDDLDIDFFNKVKEDNPEIKKDLESHIPEDYSQFENLQQDLFSSLYKYDPELEKEYRVKDEFILNHTIVEEMVKADKYQELRPYTKLDKINATVGTETLSQAAKDLYDEYKEQFDKLKEELEKNKDGEGGEEVESSESEELTLEEAKKRLKEARKNLKQDLKKQEINKKINSALSDALDKIEETENMIKNWGLDGDNNFMRMAYKDKMALLERLRNNPKLKKISELAGRFKAMAVQKQSEKVKKGTDEIYNIGIGNDIGKIIPSELMKLKNHKTKTLFYKDFLEGKLLQYDLRGKDKKNKGSIVCCIDSSGSMGGEPEIWSKAVALALLEISKLQKRSFYVVHFSHTTDINKLHTNEFNFNKPFNIEEVIDLATYFEGGKKIA